MARNWAATVVVTVVLAIDVDMPTSLTPSERMWLLCAGFYCRYLDCKRTIIEFSCS